MKRRSRIISYDSSIYSDAGNDDGGDDADALPASPDTSELYLCAFKC